MGEDQKIGDGLASSREDGRERNHSGAEASQVKTGRDACSLGSSESPALCSGFSLGTVCFFTFRRLWEWV